MKIYAISVFAVQGGNVNGDHHATWCLAEDERQAKSICLTTAKTITYPEEKGWVNHTVSVLSIPATLNNFR